MGPQLSINDFGDMPFAYSEFVGERQKRYVALSVTGANFYHLCLIEFRPAIQFALHFRLAVLGFFVRHVVGMATEKQMGWIDTTAIVAFVKNKYAIGNGAICEFIAGAVGGLHCGAGSNLPVATSTNGALPLPTIVGAAPVNKSPEAFGNWAFRCWVMAVEVSVLVSAALGFGDGLIAAASAKNDMLGHSKFSYQNLLTPPSDSRRCGGNFIGFTGVYYSTVDEERRV